MGWIYSINSINTWLSSYLPTSLAWQKAGMVSSENDIKSEQIIIDNKDVNRYKFYNLYNGWYNWLSIPEGILRN